MIEMLSQADAFAFSLHVQKVQMIRSIHGIHLTLKPSHFIENPQ